MREAGAAELGALLQAVRSGVAAPARLYLAGTTSLLAEGWRFRVTTPQLCGDAALELPVRQAAQTIGVDLLWESPADVIPIPDGWQDRALAVSTDVAPAGGLLKVMHFDPYSVVLRVVARGDEADYLVGIEFLRHGWITRERLEELHAEVVPRFTRATLAQDPAEFRRKFSGLRQMMARHRASGTAGQHAMADTGMSWL